jgi:hypothetical protein
MKFQDGESGMYYGLHIPQYRANIKLKDHTLQYSVFRNLECINRQVNESCLNYNLNLRTNIM